MLLPINYSPGIKKIYYLTAEPAKDTRTCIVESPSALVMDGIEASFTQQTVDLCTSSNLWTPRGVMTDDHCLRPTAAKAWDLAPVQVVSKVI